MPFLDSSPELNLGYFTHEKNPLMARTALETLNIIVGDDLVGHARELGRVALDTLESLRQHHTRFIPSPVRGEGLMLSFDIEAAHCNNETVASSIFYRCMGKRRDPELSGQRNHDYTVLPSRLIQS